MAKARNKQIGATIDQTTMDNIEEIIRKFQITKSSFLRQAIQHTLEDGVNNPATTLAMIELQNRINDMKTFLPEEKYMNLQVAMNNVTECLPMEGVD